jgi:hypothetical protein
MSLHNLIGVIEAFLGRKSSFHRTPKFNILSKNDIWKQNKYLTGRINYISVLEGVIALFFLGCLVEAVYTKQYVFIYFHAVLFMGFGINSFLSIIKIAL